MAENLGFHDRYICLGCEQVWRWAEWPSVEIDAFRFDTRDCHDMWIAGGRPGMT